MYQCDDKAINYFPKVKNGNEVDTEDVPIVCTYITCSIMLHLTKLNALRDANAQHQTNTPHKQQHLYTLGTMTSHILWRNWKINILLLYTDGASLPYNIGIPNESDTDLNSFLHQKNDTEQIHILQIYPNFKQKTIFHISACVHVCYTNLVIVCIYFHHPLMLTCTHTHTHTLPKSLTILYTQLHVPVHQHWIPPWFIQQPHKRQKHPVHLQ
jgi:hypothetical protein